MWVRTPSAASFGTSKVRAELKGPCFSGLIGITTVYVRVVGSVVYVWPTTVGLPSCRGPLKRVALTRAFDGHAEEIEDRADVAGADDRVGALPAAPRRPWRGRPGDRADRQPAGLELAVAVEVEAHFLQRRRRAPFGVDQVGVAVEVDRFVDAPRQRRRPRSRRRP